MERPDWNTYFKEIVEVTSRRSPCERLKVGFLPGCTYKSIIRDNHEQATVHAEQNAICDCAKRGVSCDGCIVYITHFKPSSLCHV